MRYSLVLFAVPAMLCAQEAGTGFELRTTVTEQAAYSHLLDTAPRDGSTIIVYGEPTDLIVSGDALVTYNRAGGIRSEYRGSAHAVVDQSRKTRRAEYKTSAHSVSDDVCADRDFLWNRATTMRYSRIGKIRSLCESGRTKIQLCNQEPSKLECSHNFRHVQVTRKHCSISCRSLAVARYKIGK